jgi:hypothetical protein
VRSGDERKWRNWQTHSLEVAAPARAWGFKSPLPHQHHHGNRGEQPLNVEPTLFFRKLPPVIRAIFPSSFPVIFSLKLWSITCDWIRVAHRRPPRLSGVPGVTSYARTKSCKSTEGSPLALAPSQLPGCLHLCDELLLCFLQHDQSISGPLGHG